MGYDPSGYFHDGFHPHLIRKMESQQCIPPLFVGDDAGAFNCVMPVLIDSVIYSVLRASINILRSLDEPHNFALHKHTAVRHLITSTRISKKPELSTRFRRWEASITCSNLHFKPPIKEPFTKSAWKLGSRHNNKATAKQHISQPIMPLQDPNLYGQPAPKKQKKELNLPASLTFTSQLSSLLAASSSSSATASSTTATAGRARPSKAGKDIFAGVKKKSRPGAKTVNEDRDGKLTLKEPVGTEDEKRELERARRNMEHKARLYAAMQRGDYIGKEIGLVDFDRKWAEEQEKKTGHTGEVSSSSSEDEESEEEERKQELIEYTDDFGRTRLVTPAQKAKLERSRSSAAELTQMSARPAEPEQLIVGDTIQTEAFAATVTADRLETINELAAKRDRSATPPPPTHYDANWEIRTKGVGFFQFSKDEKKREEEMRALEEERRKTEEKRREREEMLEKRKREIEERRKEIKERRAKKMADSFLQGLGEELLGGGGGGGGVDAGGESGGAGGRKREREDEES
ncbi:hypothetical protein B0T20DRAFT_467009 [Sordaria brevicollis]|uniref:Uncharacterized protein n=1 Tax=Sordaria brevicollis TaxID=83679 RepID=A0AAE0PLA6_SORBR|nr:hypothetical protein B0T20DRAFT_467009 [Sordaria brevicollis]